MAALSGSLVSVRNSQTHFLSGSSLKPVDPSLLSKNPSSLSLICSNTKFNSYKKSLTVRARSDGGGSGATGIFVGGFVLGGLVVGALGCVFAPQISEALAKTDKKEMLKKLPKFIYDEEKVLEKNRKMLEEKIAELNLAIDGVAAKFQGNSKWNEEEDEEETYI